MPMTETRRLYLAKWRADKKRRLTQARARRIHTHYRLGLAFGWSEADAYQLAVAAMITGEPLADLAAERGLEVLPVLKEKAAA